MEPACNDARHGDVLVKFLPTQCETVQFERHSLQLLIRRLLEKTEPVGRKTNNPPVGQF